MPKGDDKAKDESFTKKNKNNVKFRKTLDCFYLLLIPGKV